MEKDKSEGLFMKTWQDLVKWFNGDNTGESKDVSKSLSPERDRGRWRVSVTGTGEPRRGTSGEDSKYSYVRAEFRYRHENAGWHLFLTL